MKATAALTALLLILSADASDNSDAVHFVDTLSHFLPRSLKQLVVMFTSSLDCPSVFPIPYGCYCGPNTIWGSNDYPVPPIDDYDHLCFDHDHCYDALHDLGCNLGDMYFKPYMWEARDGDIVCHDDQKLCQLEVCKCDRNITVHMKELVAQQGCLDPKDYQGCPGVTTILARTTKEDDEATFFNIF